tara:strand:+ start:367 stop:555 length:189 start_codon:yes stop_codon:yes gene_type:complete
MLINTPSKKCLRELVGIAGSFCGKSKAKRVMAAGISLTLPVVLWPKQKISTNCLSVWATLTI